jgi:hypothetical protein
LYLFEIRGEAVQLAIIVADPRNELVWRKTLGLRGWQQEKQD